MAILHRLATIDNAADRQTTDTVIGIGRLRPENAAALKSIFPDNVTIFEIGPAFTEKESRL